jgi:CheY-like chemotaxis protein
MSIKILLADDSITIQKVVGIIFGGEEYSLTVVDNGKAAIEKAEELNPDILLIDALMPGMSGYEVCEAVRATPTLSAKPILLLTGSFEPFDEDKAKSCGADDFLAKPFESQLIMTKVKELVELGTSRSAAPAAAPISGPEVILPPPVPEAAEEPSAANDIWGAFTSSEEPQPAAGKPAEKDFLPEESTGSSWIPVEEETFEFQAATPGEPPAPAFSELEPPVEESAYGDTDFGLSATAPVTPEVEVAPVTEPEPIDEQPAATSVVPAAAVASALTEEQLREALTAASKDVIERIVWEVVPDLAEVLIKEAIRKIKEGQ